jgi:hypothetical protein
LHQGKVQQEVAGFGSLYFKSQSFAISIPFKESLDCIFVLVGPYIACSPTSNKDKVAGVLKLINL